MTRRLVCGVDEAGRGPLAGAVYAAAVILHPRKKIEGLADSKVLAEATRDRLAEQIRSKALAWSIARAEVEEIDRFNILRATLLAMKRAIEMLQPAADEAWVDGNHCPVVSIPTRAIVKGDASVPAISAASILAKTARDSDMLAWHRVYPQYGFDRHKGYGTADHLEALRTFGACPIHRTSFAPVRQLREDGWTQVELIS